MSASDTTESQSLCGKLRKIFSVGKRAMLLNRLLHDRRGGVAPMFALALIPIVGIVGATIDYSRSANIRTQLLAAADAASVGSVGKNSAAVAAAANMGADGTISAGVTEATKLFNVEIIGKTGFTISNLTATVKKAGSTITSNVDFTAQVPTSFMGLFGVNLVSIHGSSTAATSLPLYVDFYLLLDNTPSMGVGATTADINTMVSNTSDKCAFACHDLSDSNSYYNLAKNLGVTMRIDVLRPATQQLMDTAKTTAA